MGDPNYPRRPSAHTSAPPVAYPAVEAPDSWVVATADEAAHLSGAVRDQGVTGWQDPWYSAALTVWGLIAGHVRSLPPARSNGSPPGDLAAVARSATTRLGVNPTQARSVDQVGVSSAGAPFGAGGGAVSAVFLGWLLHERLVLDRYRVTWR